MTRFLPTWFHRPSAAATVLVVAISCRAEPSAKDIETQLQQHPEILYRVIEQHPVEFIAALNKAAQVAQIETQQNAVRDAAARTELEFATPKVPAVDHRIAFGNPKAPVTIVEYSDFQCPYCEKARQALVEVMKKYGDSVRVIVKQTPLDIHPHARIASLMYEAVARQDPAKAMRLYDELFNNQRKFEAQGEAYLDEAIRAVGADVARAKVDAQSAAVQGTINADLDEFKRFGYSGTPGFLINGVTLEGAQPVSAFARIIDRHLAARSSARKAPTAPPAP